MKKVSIIIPVLNEVEAIGKAVADIRRVMDKSGTAYEVLVIDDGSSDGTAEVAREAGATVICHAYNRGNGAAVKTGIRCATGDVIVLVDGDCQHNPNDIPRLLKEIPTHGMVVGARARGSQTAWYRDLANLFLRLLASYVCNHPIPDLTSGFRAVRTPLARQFLYLLPNTFSYPTTITMAVLRAGHCVAYIPIKTARRIGKSKIALLQDGGRFVVIIFKLAILFSPLRIFLPISVFITGLGIGWYLMTLLTYGEKFPPASVVMILTGIFIILTGLVSEQITQLRYERSDDDAALIIDSSDEDLM